MSYLNYMCITPELKKNGASVVLHTEKEVKSVSCKVLDADGEFISETDVLPENNKFFVSVKNPVLWMIENPYLYTLMAELTYEDGTCEAVSDTFGMRSLGVRGRDILLNEKPFYMRAVIRGTVCHDHENILDLDEEEFYAKFIRTAKEYGFNTIRFHSRIPPKACFRAADRLGMFIHIELRTKDEEYNNLEEMVNGVEVYVSDEKICETAYNLANHPSFMVYCIGNEIKHPGVNPRVREIAALIKKIDPSRLFIDTCAHGEFDRGCVEFDV